MRRYCCDNPALYPALFVNEEKLAAGEYALVQSGEFSWASLNFSSGRLEVEAAVAKPVPPIAAGTLHGMRAKTAGTVVSTNLIRGTMLVRPGQTVEAGQGLIGTARTERNGTLIFEPAAGTVACPHCLERRILGGNAGRNATADWEQECALSAAFCRTQRPFAGASHSERACGKSKTLAAGAAGAALPVL